LGPENFRAEIFLGRIFFGVKNLKSDFFWMRNFIVRKFLRLKIFFKIFSYIDTKRRKKVYNLFRVPYIQLGVHMTPWKIHLHRSAGSRQAGKPIAQVYPFVVALLARHQTARILGIYDSS